MRQQPALAPVQELVLVPEPVLALAAVAEPPPA